MIESTAASDLAARFGTPLYVTSEAALRANVRAWRTALRDAWPHGPTRVLVSLKANPTIALRRILNDEGAGCDVFGASELEIALDAGTPAELISVNGSTKPEALIVRAIAAGARLTVDSVEELAAAAAAARRLERRAHVRLRLRPDLTDLETTSEFTEHDPLGEVADAYKPGIPIDGLREALGRLDLEGVDLAGVHAHLGRHTSAVEPFRLHAQRLGALVGELARAMPGWTPREIDLGGGYSYPGDPTGRALRAAPAHTPSPAEYAGAVAGGLAEALRASGVDPRGIALEIEPGRAVYGSAGVHLSTVLNVKRQAAPVPRVWVGCDSSEVLLSDTGWEHSRWDPVCTDPVAGPDQEVDVVGVSCGFDTITPGARLPGGIAVGDVIAFLATGAYEETLAGNFNSMPRPASVLVSGDRAELVRRAETLADVTRRDRLPRRLRGRHAARGGRRPRLADGRRPRPLGRVLLRPAGPHPARPGPARAGADRADDRDAERRGRLRRRRPGVTDPGAAAPPHGCGAPADRVPAGAPGVGAHRPAGGRRGGGARPPGRGRVRAAFASAHAPRRRLRLVGQHRLLRA